MRLSSIPLEVNEKYEVLSNDVSHLHRKWGIFRQLYVSGDEIIALLIESAFGFFSVCKEVLANDIVLMISRLTDPKQSFGKDILTLEQLVYSIDAGKHPKLRYEIEQLYVESKNKCRVTKDLRNKLIAHSDLATKLQTKINPLPYPPENIIEEALESIRNVLNSVPRHFDKTDIATVNYARLVSAPGDGIKIASRLREAKAFRKQRKN